MLRKRKNKLPAGAKSSGGKRGGFFAALKWMFAPAPKSPKHKVAQLENELSQEKEEKQKLSKELEKKKEEVSTLEAERERANELESQLMEIHEKPDLSHLQRPQFPPPSPGSSQGIDRLGDR